ncbi:phage major capsid protein [Nocardia farcinica]|uniref:phage major capsid family protein n=1 Tax=Nocardia farcinica TaxID=37329 RepID=UPI0024578753|nr:phage major capsid protein [Nocardia farcinica]
MFVLTGKETKDQLLAKRTELLAKAQTIIADLSTKDGSDVPTADQEREFQAAVDGIQEIDAAIQGMKNADLMKGLTAGLPLVTGDGRVVGRTGAKGLLAFGSGTAKAAEIASALTGRDIPGVGRKDISAAPGTYLGDVITVDEPKRIGVAPVGLIDVIPAIHRGASYRYLRQTARTGGADIVEPGGLKPTLGLKLEPIDAALDVIAVLSEPVDKFVMDDSQAAQTLVQTELVDAVRLRLEQLVVDALNLTSGIQVQAWDTDLFVTIRKARLKAENLGYIPTHIALHPNDWADIELSRDTQERFQMEPSGAPVDLIEHLIWSMQVVTSVKVPAGTGFVFNATEGVAVGSDNQLAVDWDRSGALFTHNQVQGRAETRANVELYQPLGIVKADLTA